MKARRVKKLDPSRSLGENAARIVQVRLDEMLAFAPRALRGKPKAQHDMRIAAKRLRYVLELTGFVFGTPADAARRRARDLQDILGEIHDCDVMLPRVRKHGGLDVLADYVRARRSLLQDRFVDFWARQDEAGTWVRLQRAVDEHLRRARDARRTAERADPTHSGA